MGAVDSVRSSDYPSLQIVVVDNGSEVSPDQQHVEFLTDVTCLSTGANLGFAGGANKGIQWALRNGADLVWIVNPDTRVEKNTLSVLVERLATESKIGFIAPTLRYQDRNDLIRNLGFLVHPHYGCSVVAVGSGKKDSILTNFPDVILVDAIEGACMLARCETIRDIGLMPEQWFLYWEETEWCLMAKEKGWTVAVDKRASAYHGHTYDHETRNQTYYYYMIRNHLLYTRKHFPKSLIAATVRDILWIVALTVFKYGRSHAKLPGLLRICLRAMLDGLILNRYGKRASDH